MDLLILITIIICIIGALFSPIFGLFSFLVIAYIRPQDFYPYLAEMEPAKWIVVVTLISSIFHWMSRGKRMNHSYQNYALLGMLFFIFLSRISAVDSLRWWLSTQDFIVVCIAYFLIINVIDTEKRLKWFYVFFLLINLVVALRFYIAYKSGVAVYHGSKPGDASFGFLANADDLGLGMVVAFPLALIPIFYAKNIFIKFICLPVSVLFMLSALGTQSRGAIFGVVVVFIISLIFHLRPKKLKFKYLAVGSIIIMLLFSGFYYKYRWTISQSITSAKSQDDKGKIGRMATWDAAKQMIKASPLIGVGRGNYVSYWKVNLDPGVYGYQVAHNIIYEVAAEIGFGGLLFFLFFSLYGLWELRRLRRKYHTQLNKKPFFEMLFVAYTIATIGFYFNGMFITVAFYWHIYILVALFVSTKTVFLRQIRNESRVIKKKT